MPRATAVGIEVADLCLQNGFDPFAIIGLLSLHALAAGDIEGLQFWRIVSDRLRSHAPQISSP